MKYLGHQVTISTENAAFGTTKAERDEEVARILEVAGAKLRDGESLPIRLMDYNGNTVGWLGRISRNI